MYLDRWEYLKKFRKSQLHSANKMLEDGRRVKEYHSIMVLLLTLHEIKRKMAKNKEERLLSVKHKAISRKMQRSYKEFSLKKGDSFDIRMFRTIKFSIWSTILLKRQGHEYKARKILHSFFVGRKARIMFKHKWIHFGEKKVTYFLLLNIYPILISAKNESSFIVYK